MKATCPKCGEEHSDHTWVVGTKFMCMCGATVTVTRQRGILERFESLSGGKILLLLGAIGCLPLVLMGALAASYFLPAIATARQARNTSEAHTQVRQLCELLRDHRRATGSWVTASAVPELVPRGRSVAFEPEPTSGFRTLGFLPAQVRYQYEIRQQGNPDDGGTLMCLAVGDLDADGLTSNFSVTLFDNGRLSDVIMSNPLE